MTRDNDHEQSDLPEPMMPGQSAPAPRPSPRLSPRRGWLLLAAGLVAAILLPYLALEGLVTTSGAAWLESVRARPATAAAAIIALLAADIVLPVPSSIVGVFAGGVLGFARGAVVLWAGLMAGCLLGYWLGARPGRRLAGRVVGGAQVAALQRAFGRFGPLALVLARGVPVLAEASVIAAGAARLDLRLFLLATAAANVIVALAYAGLGAAAAGSGSFVMVFTGLVAIPALAWAFWTRFARRPE
ncbi:hypothetical protein GCM10007973_29500 [Polymorphobacter multimanifer]|uniref:Putative membrane protein YdjX (TVP38/TMEM64 family) n=1 Tax=Polymorphobacter multimanifer TaxID=1070431 RepID=A0A841LBV7_9SPHN|nr:VTT domain-containing protein [Polymorphobacter multimanifer]MBB6226478.1 putative membrane protein YdjX (TVP38/TMEM64 family) [Polymorphobacter multimanifer]GGI91305.1 hypothetical protein GCM10007973_29500 [Polymorphobacter multimanifer]